MGLWFRLIAQLLVILARLTSPGGVRAVAAESLAVKHQLLIMKRSQRRSPKLTAWDRLLLGCCTLWVCVANSNSSGNRGLKQAVAVFPPAI
jgi:hypothetical protein